MTGVIAAQVQSEASFRVGGKIRERLANVGDHVTAGPGAGPARPRRAAGRGAGSPGRRRSRPRRRCARRQPPSNARKPCSTTGNTTRRDHDQAEATSGRRRHSSSRRRASSRQAPTSSATPSCMPARTASSSRRMAEAGQVVAQAQPVFGLAHDGARDAVFNVHEWALGQRDAGHGASTCRCSAIPRSRRPATVRAGVAGGRSPTP